MKIAESIVLLDAGEMQPETGKFPHREVLSQSQDIGTGFVASTKSVGHLAGSTMVAPLVGDSVMPKKSCEKVGTRKPVLYEARVNTLSMGVKRTETLGLVVVPKPV